MSFKGAFIVFMDAGSYYFQKLPEHQAVKAPVLEADFSGKNRFPADEGGWIRKDLEQSRNRIFLPALDLCISRIHPEEDSCIIGIELRQGEKEK